MKTILKISAFLVATMFWFSWSASFISAADTLQVVLGVSMLVAWFCLVFYLSDGIAEWIVNRWEKLTVIAILALSLVGCTRVNPGNVGIQVNYYGTDKGVSSYPSVSGMVWYNPATTSVFEYPTFVQTATWEKEERMIFNSKEGMLVSADVSLSYQLIADKVPSFYVKFRSDDLDKFTHGFLRNVARDAFNETAATYVVDDIYGPKKEEILGKVRERINALVTPFGVQIQQLGFIGAPTLPESVVAALNAKIKATQDAIRVENELRSAEAEAKKRIAQAEGDAKANIARANGEATANRVLAESLTPNVLDWQRLQIQQHQTSKWNGVLPTVTGAQPSFLLQVQK